MTGFRFPKSMRKKGAARGSRMVAESKSGSKYFLLLAKQNGIKHPRIALAIGKRLVPLSTERSRIKRIIRESYRHNQHLISGLDIIVIARQPLAKLDNKTLRKNIDKTWSGLT